VHCIHSTMGVKYKMVAVPLEEMTSSYEPESYWRDWEWVNH
jgi:hypothetical protein